MGLSSYARQRAYRALVVELDGEDDRVLPALRDENTGCNDTECVEAIVSRFPPMRGTE